MPWPNAREKRIRNVYKPSLRAKSRQKPGANVWPSDRKANPLERGQVRPPETSRVQMKTLGTRRGSLPERANGGPGGDSGSIDSTRSGHGGESANGKGEPNRCERAVRNRLPFALGAQS
jgi:hypothetical protein